jgi:signal transduction histidine kinase
MQSTDDGTLLIGISRRGLLQLANQEVVPVSEAQELASETVWTIQRLKSGRMLLGTSQGLYELMPDRQIKPISLAGIPFKPVVRAILETDEGAIWLATDGQGLIRWRDGEARAYGPNVGLLDNNFFSVLRDELGNLWVSSTRGIARIREKDFEELDAGRIAAVNCTTFGRADGLVSSSSAGAGYPVATRLHDGRLITATDRGFVAIVPSAIKTNAHVPNVIVESVTADETALRLTDKIIVPAGTNRLEMKFTALSLIAPERVRFRYRLHGSDKTWVEADHQRSATYTHLPPGSYTFQVLACNNDGVWNEVGASQKVEILPKFYQTLSFRIGMIVVVVGSIAGSVGFVVHRRVEEKLRVLERRHALEKERTRIARDLHDELGAGLTEAGLLTDQLAETAPAGLSPQLTGLAWRIRRLGADLSGIVWTMNVKHSSLADLATFIRRYTERLFRHTGIRYKVTGVEAIPPLQMGTTPRHEVVAAVKEALNNIIKHARATEAEVRFAYTGNIFEVRIEDNGSGFDTAVDAEAALNGNGLRNMRARMEEIGGAIVLTSTPGHGTCVIFRVPCPNEAPLS